MKDSYEPQDVFRLRLNEVAFYVQEGAGQLASNTGNGDSNGRS
jgi:hypothetical protein